MNRSFHYFYFSAFLILFLVIGIFYLEVRPVKTVGLPEQASPSFVFVSPKPELPEVTFLPVDFFSSNSISPSPLSKQLKLKSESALLYDFASSQAIFSKNSEKKLLVASLTKLMTALVAKENLSSEKQKFFVSEEDLSVANSYSDLKPNDAFSFDQALHFLLIRSDNALAKVLSRSIFLDGEKFFVYKMNEKAQKLGMKETIFYDSVGLANNFSTVLDLRKLVQELLSSHQEIFLISKIPSIKIISENERVFDLRNTNTVLGKIPGVLGSKTGYTPEAGGSLLIVFKDGQKNILAVVLGSQDRFADISALIDWYWRNRN